MFVRPPNPPSPDPAASFKLELVSANAGLVNNPIAKCLAAVRVNLAATSCAVSLTPLSSGGSYVPGIFTGASGVSTYTVLRECPVTNSTAVNPDTKNAAGIKITLTNAFNNFAYSGSAKGSLASLEFAAGKLTLTIDSTKTLVYAITEVRVPGAAGPGCRATACCLVDLPLPHELARAVPNIDHCLPALAACR